MKHDTAFIRDIMDRIRLTPQEKDFFIAIEKRLDEEAEFGARFDELARNGYYQPSGRDALSESIKQIDPLAEDMGLSPYSLAFVYLLSLSEELKRRYEAAGIDESVYYDSLQDLRYKLTECEEVEGVMGTFVALWFDCLFSMSIFQLGRFQYQTAFYTQDEPYSFGAFELKKGDFYVCLHIPNSGESLNREVRMASYRRAHEFFRERFPDGITRIGCGSWLLAPELKEFLPESSRILDFQKDFLIFRTAEEEKFFDAWRVYGAAAKLPMTEWPENNSLQRGYKQYLLSGRKSHRGDGALLFDGEKLLTSSRG